MGISPVKIDDSPAESGLWIGEARVVARHDDGGQIHLPGLLVRSRQNLPGTVAGPFAFARLSGAGNGRGKEKHDTRGSRQLQQAQHDNL